MKQLSIIIPVYNVEKYIRPCIDSVFHQELDETCYEIVIVNDGTKDNSMKAIADIISEHTNIIVVNQNNQGLSMARNNGMEIASGKYILFLDSDDLLATNSLSILLEHAIKSDADLVVANFHKMNDEEIIEYHKAHTQQRKSIVQEKRGLTLLIEDLNPRECYVWRTLYKKSFLTGNHIRFIPGIYYEDIPFTHECYLKAGKCLRIDTTLYIYRIGHSSITTRINKKTGTDFGTTIAKTWKLSLIEGLPLTVKQKIKDDVFVSFSTLLYGLIHEVPSKADRKHILNHIKQEEPNLYFSHGAKQKIVSLMYKIMPSIYIEARVLYSKYISKQVRY